MKVKKIQKKNINPDIQLVNLKLIGRMTWAWNNA